MKHLTLVVILAISVASCHKNDENKSINTICNNVVEISAHKYNNAHSEYFVIDTAFITNHCLNITIGASGCDGSSWGGALYDEGVIMESYPIQRNIKFVLTNEELCLAYFTKTFTFDLQPTQANYEDNIYFNIDGWSGSLLYEY